MSAAPPAVWEFDAIGTRWQVQTGDPLPAPVRADVERLIARFDREWSRFRTDSVVRALERGGEVPAPADATDMLDLYAELSAATGGAVNPLVGESLARRGYDPAYSLRDHGARPAPERWRDLLTWRDAVLALRAPAVIDVGALGKGRLVDLVTDRLRELLPDEEEPAALVVDAGGHIRLSGVTERIALEHPYDPAKAVGVWELAGGALCASAVNRRAWGDGLHHVLDARTGEPVRQISATWAVAPTAMLADAVATALFFDGGPELAHRRGTPWVRMTTAGQLEWSPGAPGAGVELFVRRSSDSAPSDSLEG